MNRVLKGIIISFVFSIILATGVTHYFFPLKYQKEIREASIKYEVPMETIFSIIKIESNFNPRALSRKNARGLMQITPRTGRWLARINKIKYSKELLYNESYNITLGTLYLSILQNRYDDINKTLVAYNAGPKNLENGRWKNFKETKNYLIKYKIYSILYKVKLFMYLTLKNGGKNEK